MCRTGHEQGHRGVDFNLAGSETAGGVMRMRERLELGSCEGPLTRSFIYINNKVKVVHGVTGGGMGLRNPTWEMVQIKPQNPQNSPSQEYIRSPMPQRMVFSSAPEMSACGGGGDVRVCRRCARVQGAGRRASGPVGRRVDGDQRKGKSAPKPRFKNDNNEGFLINSR